MRKTDNKMMAFIYALRNGSHARKTILMMVFFLGAIGTTSAQSHEHDDSLIILQRGDFTLTSIQSGPNQFNLQVRFNRADTLKPFFIELYPVGFDFTDNCIIHQSLNNQSLETNIEKLWGPQFVSLGIGNLPPGTSYTTTLGTALGTNGESMIRVRIYGTLNGHNFLWSGFIKK